MLAHSTPSQVRTQLLRELCGAAPPPVSLGYAYFRATVRVDPACSSWHQVAFESWGDGIRFGFVPLQAPEVFWFCAIPIDGVHVKQSVGSVAGDAHTKAFLQRKLQGWQSVDQVDPLQLLAWTPAESILRTDIQKHAAVDDFPWQGHDGRVVLLGDSAHATAPNLAQGAGLSIEDAITLADLLDRHHHPHAPARTAAHAAVVPSTWACKARQYEFERKPRAATVQQLADLVARVGQLPPGASSTLRDMAMRTATHWLPTMQQNIFAAIVSVSLGGDATSRRTWLPPPLHTRVPTRATSRLLASRSILGMALGRRVFESLPVHIQSFRASPTGGSGTGVVSVQLGEHPVARMLARAARLPPDLTNVPFRAQVSLAAHSLEQHWTRTFHHGSPQAVSITTRHRAHLSWDSARCNLTESVGGWKWLDRLCSFMYQTHVGADPAGRTVVEYDSVGFCVAGLRAPLPLFLRPHSSWTETALPHGWAFEGQITLPFVGRLMRYHGDFRIESGQVVLVRSVLSLYLFLLMCHHSLPRLM